MATVFEILLLTACLVGGVSEALSDRSWFVSKTGNITIGFILPVHSSGSNQKNDYDYATTCGKFEPSRALLVAQFRRAIDEINNNTSILPNGLKLGYWIIDSCSTSAVGLLQAVNQWAGNKANVPGQADKATHERLPAIVIGAYKSSLSAVLAQTLQQFDIPLIDFAATSPDLSDRRRYRLFARTSPSDVYQATAMAELVSSYGWSCVHLVYSRGTYGDHGSDELKAALRRKHVCIGTEAGITTGLISSERAELYTVVERFHEWPEIRIVLCFCEDTTVKGLLTALWNYEQTEFDNDGRSTSFLVVASDYWGTKLDLNGLESVADGAVTFSLSNTANMTRFNEWFFNASTFGTLHQDPDPWYREYAESVLKCTTFPCEMSDSKRQRMNSSLQLAEDVTGLLNTSVYAAAYGLRTFLQQAPAACLKGLLAGSMVGCGLSTRDGARTLYDTIRQTTFRINDGGQLFRFDENGDGYDPNYDIWQYSRYNGYSKLGEWSLDRGLLLNSETNEYGQPLMYWPDLEQNILVTSNCSCQLNESGAMTTMRTRAPVTTSPRPIPCNNETVFWSMYGLVAQQLKNCQCGNSTTREKENLSSNGALNSPSTSQGEGQLLPVVIALGAILGVLVISLMIVGLFIVIRGRRAKRGVENVRKKTTVVNKNSRAMSLPNPNASLMMNNHRVMSEQIPVHVLPPSFISLNSQQTGNVPNSSHQIPNGSVPNRKISGNSTSDFGGLMLTAASPARSPSPRPPSVGVDGYIQREASLTSSHRNPTRNRPVNLPMSRFSTASSASSTSAVQGALRSPSSSVNNNNNNTVSTTAETYHSPTTVGTSSVRSSNFFSILQGVRESQELTEMVERWNIPGYRLSFGEQLGQGRFGIVFKGSLKQEFGLQEVAVKVLKSMSSDAIVQFLQEGFIMQGFDHPNILKLIGIAIIEDQPNIIVPYMKNGNLRDFLTTPENGAFYQNENGLHDLLDFCIQICSGMEYLAKNKCIHRDLACRNILVGDANLLKIADFGLARDLFETDYYSPSTLHRPLPVRWHPPESLRLHRFEERSDVWSFGVVCWEIFSFGQQPYSQLTNAQVFDYVLSGSRLQKPDHCPPDMYYEVMLKCWDEYRSLRPSFSELLVTLQQLTNAAFLTLKTSNVEEPELNLNLANGTAPGADTDSLSHYSQYGVFPSSNNNNNN